MEKRMQLNIYMDKALAAELNEDAAKQTKLTGRFHTRQDMLKLAHRAWKNLKANATKKEGK
jgi:hypothetical protein